MTLNAKNLTNLAVAALMIGLAAWASIQMLVKPDTQWVGVVEVSDVP